MRQFPGYLLKHRVIHEKYQVTHTLYIKHKSDRDSLTKYLNLVVSLFFPIKDAAFCIIANSNQVRICHLIRESILHAKKASCASMQQQLLLLLAIAAIVASSRASSLHRIVLISGLLRRLCHWKSCSLCPTRSVKQS